MADKDKTTLQDTAPAADPGQIRDNADPGAQPVDTSAAREADPLHHDSSGHREAGQAAAETFAYYTDPDTGNFIPMEADDSRGENLLKDLSDHIAGLFLQSEGIKDTGAPAGEILRRERERRPDIEKRWQSFIQAFMDTVYDDLQRSIDAMQKIGEEIGTLRPFLDEELKKPEYNGATIKDLLNEFETFELADGIPDGSTLDKAITAAREAAAKKPGKATITRTDTIDFPLDKVNSRVWRLLETDTGGQIGIDFNTAKTGSADNSHVYYAIDFENLSKDVQITRRLLPFDKRVYIAVAALFNAGNEVITLTQIYYHMGYKGTPGASDLEKIETSVIKMLGAQIIIDNKTEADAYKYPRAKYRGALLPVEAGELYDVNGRLTNAAIHLFREPPLVSFARDRGQITTVNLSLLQSPVNKTDSNILIDDYLIERISRAKNGKGNTCRILFKTLFDHCEMSGKTEKDRKQRARAPKKIERYLKYYEKDGFIKSYTMGADKVDIFL